MSGGGGGRGDFGSGGGGSSDACESLRIETILNSPVAAVVATLSVGQELDVEVRSTKSGKVLVAQTTAGAIAGSLTPPSLLTIIGCIERGYSFKVIVLEISGGVVRVRMEARR